MVENLSYYVVNDKGYFGNYLFTKRHIPENHKLISEISDFSNIFKETTIIWKYPNYADLFNHIDKLEEHNVVILLDITQSKEIQLANNYFSKLDLDFELGLIAEIPVPITEYDYLNMDTFSNEELKKLSKTKNKFKILYIYERLKYDLNLNPTKLRNFNFYENITFSLEDFKNLDKNKFPKSYDLLELNDLEKFYEVLYEELLNIEEPEDLILKKFSDKSLVDEDGLVETSNFTKEERRVTHNLSRKHKIYFPKRNYMKQVVD